MASSLVLAAMKILLLVMACSMGAALAYTIILDGEASCYDPTARWTHAVETDFLVFMTVVVVWFFYKESSWIKGIVFTAVMLWCGGLVSCPYIAWQFHNLSPEESSKDPFYFALARRQNRDVTGHTTRSSFGKVKVTVTAIGCFLLGMTIYAYTVHGFPFYMEVLTPCFVATFTDVCIHTVVFSMWIAYKESSWISVVIWILVLVCFSGVGLCVYLLRELFNLSSGQPISFVLFNKRSKAMRSSDPQLKVQ